MDVEFLEAKKAFNHSDNMSLASMFCFLGAGHWSKRARRFWVGLGCKQSKQNEVLQRGKHLGCKLCKETLFSCAKLNAQQKSPTRICKSLWFIWLHIVYSYRRFRYFSMDIAMMLHRIRLFFVLLSLHDKDFKSKQTVYENARVLDIIDLGAWSLGSSPPSNMSIARKCLNSVLLSYYSQIHVVSAIILHN